MDFLLLQNNYESNLPIDLLNIPRFSEYNQVFRVMMTRHAKPNTTKISKVIKIQALNYCVADKMSYDEYLFCMQFSSSSQFE